MFMIKFTRWALDLLKAVFRIKLFLLFPPQRLASETGLAKGMREIRVETHSFSVFWASLSQMFPAPLSLGDKLHGSALEERSWNSVIYGKIKIHGFNIVAVAYFISVCHLYFHFVYGFFQGQAFFNIDGVKSVSFFLMVSGFGALQRKFFYALRLNRTFNSCKICHCANMQMCPNLFTDEYLVHFYGLNYHS